MGCRHKSTHYSGEQHTEPKGGKVIVFVEEICNDCGKTVRIHNRRTEDA